MCYAIPGKVVSFDENTAVIDYFGEKKRVIIDRTSLKEGDYVFAQGGFVIKTLDEESALSILESWKETFFSLQEQDLRLSRMHLEEKGVRSKIVMILDKALEMRLLSYHEQLELMSIENESEIEYLCKVANFLRSREHDNSCCVHGIIEFSSYCRRNCSYCGLSVHNQSLKRYRMDREKLIETVRVANEVYGFQAIVLQSGEDPEFSVQSFADVLREIKRRFDVLIFISVGELSKKALQELYDAGARGILLRFETSNPELYAKLHPGYTLDKRLKCMENARSIGYHLISGGLVGIPGQSHEDRLNDLLLAKKLGCAMMSFGPFVPHPDTPMHDYPQGDESLMLKQLAMARIIDPQNPSVLVTTAFETIARGAAERGLKSGANSLMLNVTPTEFREFYDIYPGRAHRDESIDLQIKNTLSLLQRLGRAPTDLGVRIGLDS